MWLQWRFFDRQKSNTPIVPLIAILMVDASIKIAVGNLIISDKHPSTQHPTILYLYNYPLLKIEPHIVYKLLRNFI